VTSIGLAALDDLRAQRRKNRIARLDWFEAAYRAYLAAFLGGLAVVWTSGTIGGAKVTASELATATTKGPALLGVLTALAIAIGLRSGSRGGPLALEPAEVRHVLLSPIDRRRALRSTAIKAVRHRAFAGLTAGATFGVLAAQRLPGGRWQWAASGAAFGLTTSLAMVAAAFLASGLRLKPMIATGLAGITILGAVADVQRKVSWPTTAVGSLGLWAQRVHPIDLASLVVIVAVLATGLALLDRLSLEHAERRTALVGQMRFAVTLQDLRTVTVLRRQLTAEFPRRRPWLGVRKRRPARHFPYWARSWQGLLRTPIGRISRMVGLSAIVGLLLPAILHGTGSLVFVAGIATYLIGLDIIEPLAQAVDKADRTELAPIERGIYYLHLLPASAVAEVILSGISAGVAIALTHTSTDRRLVALAAPVAMLAGMAGAVISVLMGAPDPSGNSQLLPPEVAGVKIAGRAAWPFIVAILGGLPLIFAQKALAKNKDAIGSFGRTAIWVGILIAMVTAWVRHRDAARAWWQTTMKQSQEQAAARKKQS
jgi:hypothetical protein